MQSSNPASLTWSEATARRMARHALTEPATNLDAAGVAGAICGAHAQILSAAELSLGRRVAGATRSDIQRARAHRGSEVDPRVSSWSVPDRHSGARTGVGARLGVHSRACCS